MQGDELEDAHRFIARVDRKADGTGNAAILTSDKIAGLPRLQLEDTIVEAHGAEDFAMAHTAALDAEKRGIAVRGEILLFKSSSGWVGGCVFVDNYVRRDGAVFESEVGERVNLRNDAEGRKAKPLRGKGG